MVLKNVWEKISTQSLRTDHRKILVPKKVQDTVLEKCLETDLEKKLVYKNLETKLGKIWYRKILGIGIKISESASSRFLGLFPL